MFDVRGALLVARLDLEEPFRDAQIGWLLGGGVLLVHALLLGNGALDPGGAPATIVLVGAILCLFLASPRRGAAHEQAFRRLVSTQPIGTSEWLAGRIASSFALALAYALLVAPAFAVEVGSAAWDPLATTLDAIAAFVALAFVAILSGLTLGASGRTKAPALALLAFGALVVARLASLPRAFAPGAPFRVAALLLSFLPPVQASLAGALASGVDAPAWAIAFALAGTIALLSALLWRAHGERGRALVAACAAVWLAGAIALGATLAPGARVPEARADANWDAYALLAPLALVALVPMGIAFSRRFRARGLEVG